MPRVPITCVNRSCRRKPSNPDRARHCRLAAIRHPAAHTPAPSPRDISCRARVARTTRRGPLDRPHRSLAGESSEHISNTAGVTSRGWRVVSGLSRSSLPPRNRVDQPRRCARCERVHGDVLRRAVVGLAEVAVDVGLGTREHDAPVVPRIHGSHTACATYALPFRCTFIAMSQSSSDMCLNDLSRRMPALLTRMCSMPNAPNAASTIDFEPSRLDTDTLFAIAVPPAAGISVTTPSAASPEPVPWPLPPRSFTTTFAPRRANSSAYGASAHCFSYADGAPI